MEQLSCVSKITWLKSNETNLTSSNVAFNTLIDKMTNMCSLSIVEDTIHINFVCHTQRKLVVAIWKLQTLVAIGSIQAINGFQSVCIHKDLQKCKQ